jgi:hypothetical protein
VLVLPQYDEDQKDKTTLHHVTPSNPKKKETASHEKAAKGHNISMHEHGHAAHRTPRHSRENSKHQHRAVSKNKVIFLAVRESRSTAG